MKKVFISHASRDLNIAIRICNQLEQAGLLCWYSDRNLDKQTNYWQDELIQSLTDCNAVILVLSQSTLKSSEVLNEVVLASAQNKLILVYFIEELSLTQKFEYYLRKYQWIYAYNMSEKNAISVLFDKLSILEKALPLAPVEIKVNELFKRENKCFNGIQNGGYGAGFDKCLISNGPSGWSPNEIYIEFVERCDFEFTSIGHPELDTHYQLFCHTSEFKKIVSRGNNHTRWMLSEIYQNERIYLTLQKTEWSRATFWWNQVRDNPDMQKSMALHVFQNQTPFFPNSLCLHLIVETADNLLVCTRISVNKKNDYAYTIAVTLGEQLNEVDFSSGDMNNNHFICEWCKRALIEEFGFSNENYYAYTDETSIRVLGINYEGDIYNFSIPTYVKLHLTYENLCTHISSALVKNLEFTDAFAMTKDEVIDTLKNPDNLQTVGQYHPSSFLRMIQYLDYRYPGAIS